MNNPTTQINVHLTRGKLENTAVKVVGFDNFVSLGIGDVHFFVDDLAEARGLVARLWNQISDHEVTADDS